jgi:hypothetical protein
MCGGDLREKPVGDGAEYETRMTQQINAFGHWKNVDLVQPTAAAKDAQCKALSAKVKIS